MELVYSLDDIRSAAGLIHTVITGNKKIIAFHGLMGAGKTTIIHILCQLMNVQDVVGSPTYAIINEYNSSEGIIFHIDLFRLADAEEALQAGVEDCLYSNEICLVEWPERAPSIFPGDTVHVYLEVVDEKTRHLRIIDY